MNRFPYFGFLVVCVFALWVNMCGGIAQ